MNIFPRLLLPFLLLVASPNWGRAQTEVLWASVHVPLPVSMEMSEIEQKPDSYVITPRSGGAGSIGLANFRSDLSLQEYRDSLIQRITANGGKMISNTIKGRTLTMHYLDKAPESQLFSRFLTKVTARSDDYVGVMMASLESEWNTASRRSLNKVFNGIKVEQTGILDQLIGTWNMRETRRYGGQKWGFSSEYMVTKAGVGSFDARVVTFSEEYGNVFTDISFSRDGSLEGRSYAGETTVQEVMGTWEIKRGRLYTVEFWTSEYGPYRATGSLRRVNQNKWAGSGTIQGGIRTTTSMTRVR